MKEEELRLSVNKSRSSNNEHSFLRYLRALVNETNSDFLICLFIFMLYQNNYLRASSQLTMKVNAMLIIKVNREDIDQLRN